MHRLPFVLPAANPYLQGLWTNQPTGVSKSSRAKFCVRSPACVLCCRVTCTKQTVSAQAIDNQPWMILMHPWSVEREIPLRLSDNNPVKKWHFNGDVKEQDLNDIFLRGIKSDQISIPLPWATRASVRLFLLRPGAHGKTDPLWAKPKIGYCKIQGSCDRLLLRWCSGWWLRSVSHFSWLHCPASWLLLPAWQSNLETQFVTKHNEYPFPLNLGVLMWCSCRATGWFRHITAPSQQPGAQVHVCFDFVVFQVKPWNTFEAKFTNLFFGHFQVAGEDQWKQRNSLLTSQQ